MSLILRILRTIGYVTCLPAAKTGDEEELNGLAQFLPLAGLVIGACLCAVDFALSQAPVDKLLEAGILTVLWLVLTNGLHFDGLMDTADGIFSHQNRERMLEIMQDSRVGNFGVLAGVSVFLLKFLSLATMPSAWHIPVLLLVPACGRWAETFAIGAFPYAKSEGKGKIWHDSANYPHCLFTASIAPALVALGAVLLGYWQVWLICASTIVSGIMAAYWLAHKLGGHTGDTYGCVVELSETGGLIACALALTCH